MISIIILTIMIIIITNIFYCHYYSLFKDHSWVLKQGLTLDFRTISNSSSSSSSHHPNIVVVVVVVVMVVVVGGRGLGPMKRCISSPFAPPILGSQ